MNLQLAMFVKKTKAEGPGERFALWVQGCDLGCPDCCNPEMWAPDRGDSLAVDYLLQEILSIQDEIEGVSFLGGEPFQQDEGLGTLAKQIKNLTDLNIMVYSGYDLEEIEAMNSSLLPFVDLLVAGRYIKEQRTTKRRWIGSENQKLHFLTNCYSPEDPCFSQPNHAEISLTNTGELTVVGFPFDSIRKSFPKKIDV